MALGFVPGRYQRACSERISSVVSFWPPYQREREISVRRAAVLWRWVWSLSRGLPFCLGPAPLVRSPRLGRSEQAGVEPQPADEACVASDGVREFVGSEAGVADEDDRLFREPAKDHEHALSHPVGERFASSSPLQGPIVAR